MIAALKNSDIPPKAGSVAEMFEEYEANLLDRLGPDGRNHNSMVCMSFTCDKAEYDKLGAAANDTDEVKFKTNAPLRKNLIKDHAGNADNTCFRKIMWNLMRDKEGHDDIVEPTSGAGNNEDTTVSFKFEKSEDIAVGRKKITFKIQATTANNS